MIVTVIRHGKVKHTWKKRCTSAEFDEECRLYDCAPIENMAKIDDLEASNATKVYISTLDRSHQTARMLFGNIDFCSSDRINEVPLKSSFDIGLRLPLWLWNVSGRLQWFWNSGRQPESRRQTRERAEGFVQKLIESEEDCTLVTHGFFMHTLISVLKRHGFRSNKAGIHYQNGEAIVFEKYH